jgi:hypothetical protein
MTCNPGVFKEHFVFSNIMIALAGGLSTEACTSEKYCSVMQDMVSLSGFVCYD